MRKYIIYILSVLTISLCSTGLFAQSIILTDSSTVVPTLSFTRFYEDDSNRLSIHSARNADFQYGIPGKLSAGWAINTHWATFDLENASDVPLQVTYVLANRDIDSVSFFVYSGGVEQSQAHCFNGKADPLNYEPYMNGIVFKFNIKPNSSLTCFLRLNNAGDVITYAPSLYVGSVFQQKKQGFLLFSGFYLGVVLILLVTSFIYFSFQRGKYYRYYSIYLFTILFLTAYINGILYSMLSEKYDVLLDLFFSVILYLNLVSFFMFMTSLLHTKENLPKLYTVTKIFTQLILPIAFLLLLNNKGLSFNLAVVSAFPLILIVVCFSLYIKIKAAFYFLALIVVSIATLLVSNFGVFNEDCFFAANILTAAYFVNISVLFFAVARRYLAEKTVMIEQLADRQQDIEEYNAIVVGKNIDLEKEIVARKQAEEEQLKLQSQLIESNKMETMGRLAGGIAHDFNNILTPIIGHADLALDDCQDADLREDLDMILKSALRAKDLVKQILTFSRKYKQEATPVDVYHIVQETIDLLYASFPKNIIVEYSLPSSQLYVMANEVQLQQVILNLCTNAKDAIGDSPGFIRIKQDVVSFSHDERELKQGKYVKISIADTGTGMSEETVSNIFYPFFTTKPKGSGTGLGLSVAHGIILGFGGRIDVNSTLGKGTVFTIYLPYAFPVAFEDVELPIISDSSSNSGNILVVDDEEPIRNMIATRLRKNGYFVETKENGKVAFEYLKEQNGCIDLIITDQMMPEMNGDELIAKVRSNCSKTKIILVTGYSEKLHGKTAEDILADDLVFKPFDFKQLLAKVQDILGAPK